MSLRDWAEETLAEDNPAALFFDGFDEAIVGVARQFTNPGLVVYSWDQLVQTCMDRDGMSREEAIEYLSFNTAGAWLGPDTLILETP